MEEERDRYHHFIPRFVLRRFSDPNLQPATAPPPSIPASIAEVENTYADFDDKSSKNSLLNPAASGSMPKSDAALSPVSELAHALESTSLGSPTMAAKDSNKKRRKKKNKQRQNNNPLVRFYDLKQFKSTVRNVSDCYGNPAMYKDASAEDSEHIENQLSKLEGKAAVVIKRILDSQSAGARFVRLTRAELNDVRKFVFVMHYRGLLFWRKYSATKDKYSEVDRDLVMEYMQKMGFEHPIQVWLHTLKSILDTTIDVRGEWMESIQNTMFPLDAEWFTINMRSMYASFCQPGDMKNDEFLISENSFGIHEGPTGVPVSIEAVLAGATRPGQKTQYLEWHKFVPLAPSLMLILRQNILLPQHAETRADMARIPGGELFAIPSLLEDFKIPKATGSYDKTGMGVSLDQLSESDTFVFPLVNVPAKYMQTINSIILKEAKGCITWKTDELFAKYIERFLLDERFMLTPDEELEELRSFITHSGQVKLSFDRRNHLQQLARTLQRPSPT